MKAERVSWFDVLLTAALKGGSLKIFSCFRQTMEDKEGH